MMLIAFLLAAIIPLFTAQNLKQVRTEALASAKTSSAVRMLTNGTFSIFGMRWMLGNHFSYRQSNSNQYYILMFNSKLLLPGQVKLYLQKSAATCSYRTLTSQNQTEYIYRCNINTFLAKSEIGYRIVKEQLVIEGSEENTTMKYESQTLYASHFRPINNQIQPIFLGNLDIGSQNQITLLTNRLDSNKNINLLMFTGNFFPQLTLDDHQSLLFALQPISSVISIVLLNVNSISQYQNYVFSQLFFTPQSQLYQSYFWMVTMPGKVMIMGINHIIQANTPPSNQNYTQIQNLIESQLQDIIKQIAIKQPFLILMAPNFESSSALPQKNRTEMICSRILNDSNVNLYLSSTNQGYLRTELSRQNSSSIKNKDQYSFDNTIHINEGTNLLSLDNSNSSYDIYRPQSGFGVLQLDGNYDQPSSIVTYQHISFSSGKIEDEFTLNRTLNKDNPKDAIITKVRKITIAIEFAFLLGSIIFIAYVFIKLKLQRARQGNDHVQMVQQMHNNPQNQMRAPIN